MLPLRLSAARGLPPIFARTAATARRTPSSAPVSSAARFAPDSLGASLTPASLHAKQLSTSSPCSTPRDTGPIDRTLRATRIRDQSSHAATDATGIKLHSEMSEASRAPGSSRALATAATTFTSGSAPFESLPPGFEIHPSVDGNDAAPYAVFTRPLELSGQDDRSYRLIRLANGLEALVIHDTETDKASAAMDVRVGHLSDPEELQGLAHFCEHLLFMGTKKYPRENEYSEYLSNNSGASNAYTGMENTNYFFDVGHSHLEGALDRFSQFFISPLFDPGCTEREIRAVDSEHKKNLQSDAWRSFQLEKSLSDPRHPYSHFGTGNLKTLWDDPKGKGMDVRDELLKFHDKYYSANVMRLVVLGRESLDQLTHWVVDKFSGVRNKGVAAPTFPGSPLGAEQLQTQVFFRSVKDIRLLDVTFPIPDQGPHFRSKPGQIVSHFVGHEGVGSILSHLKAKGWANHLSAGATNGADGFEFFKISVDLTQSGLQNYQEVVQGIFQYIDLLRASAVPEWSFKEVQQLCDLAYRFKEKVPPASYASALATQMQMPFPREWVLSGPYLTREFDQDLIRKTIDCLTPANCRITVAAQKMPDGSKDWAAREKWYGTEYKLTALPETLLRPSNGHVSQGLALPKRNDFVPSDLEVASVEAFRQPGYRPTKRPTLLSNTPLGRLWHKRDDQFLMPKANLFMLLRSPLIDATPNNAVKSRVFVELVKDALTEYSYDAELAGLGYNIESQADGIGLSVDGYSHKLPVLCRYILEEIAKFKVDPKRFDIIKDSVRRGYQNFSLEAPYQHANYYMTYLLVERMWTAEEKLVELELLTPDDLQRFLPDLLGRLHIETLAHGNVTPARAGELMALAEDILAPKPLAASELVSHRSLILPRPCNFSWSREVANVDNVNSSIEYYCQIGDPVDFKQRATLALLAQIASEPVFDQLRTKEQLGYLVFSSPRKTIGSMGFRILVQSERDSRYVESRIDAFLDQFKAHLEGLSESEFLAQRESLIHKKLEVPKNLYEESSRFWFHIHSGYYDFLQRDVDVASLRKLAKRDVVDLFNTYIHHSSPTRSKVCVHLRSQVKPQRFGVQAGEKLREVARSSGIPISEDEFAALKAQQPNVEMVKEYTRANLARADPPMDEAKTAQLMATIDKLATEYPAETDMAEDDVAEEQSRREASTEVEITDVNVFKAGLQPSRAAQPVRPWYDFTSEPAADSEERGYARGSDASPTQKPPNANL
ncbi:related to ste23-metalloprotease involved in a-factor processing [Ceraceosorus bombacis]|uniref:Related to ste23-metalloprotease involved in a-factor processing n=1 Tax=Ceraceosorus bombacis TaxID=401625 RepID=A0A0P1BQG7_9BASI|nr:related to ste23-metalloprotease involved in a-factor processing [Ceraceosorus bombacis]